MTDIIKWQRNFLLLMILFLPFTHFSVSLPIAHESPYLLFLVIGYLLFLYEYIVLGIEFNIWEKIGILFLIILIIWNAITGIIGIIDYKYFGQINLLQMENFKNFYDNVSPIIPLDEEWSIKMWLIYKEIQSAFLDVLYSYLVSLWIYHIYKRNKSAAFEDLRKIIVVLSTILILYSIFEVDYLTGGVVGKEILSIMNPLYMKIADVHDWWPPLLWTGQLRSLFAEPSFFGIYTAMSIPILLSFFFEKNLTKKSITGIVIYVFLVIMLILSKARTATVLFCIELLLTLTWVGLLKKEMWKQGVLVVFSTLLAFLIGLTIMTHFKAETGQSLTNVSAESYVSQNITSVVGNKRSNNARFANVNATIKVGLQNPIFGVGHNLKDVYLDKNLEADDRQNQEVANWSSMMYEKGPLKSSYPILNQLAGVFAESGIIGVLIFLLPILFIGFCLIKEKDIIHNNKVACMTIALIGLCLAFFSNVATVSFYIVVGFMLVLLDEYKEKTNEK